MINPIIAMQEHRAAKELNETLIREAQLIIEAGYHCGWSSEEITRKLQEAGFTLADEQIDVHYDKYHASCKG